MKKVKNIVKEDMYKIFSGGTFWCAVFAVLCIQLMGSVGADMYKVRHNVLDIAINYSVEEMMSEFVTEISVKSIILSESSSYLWMFAPVLAGLPLIPLICSERKNKAMRYELLRVGKKKFVVGKLLSACLSGGAVLICGYALFCVAVYVLIPIKGGNYFPECMSFAGENHPGIIAMYNKVGFTGLLGFKLILFFAYGAISSVFAYALTSFISNKYIVLCVPYIVNYVISMFVERQSMSNKFYELPRILVDGLFALQQNRITSIYGSDWQNIWMFIGVQGLFVIIAAVVYFIVVEKRCDCGQ